MRSSRIALLAVLGLGCRDGCVCRRLVHNRVVDSVRERVPEPMVREQVIQVLSTDAEISTNLCGVSVRGLANIVVVVDPQAVEILGQGSVRVRGTPIVDGDGGLHLAPLVCAGVVAYSFTRAIGDHEHPWRFSSVELSSVETPGVHWSAPAGHHHHHHH